MFTAGQLQSLAELFIRHDAQDVFGVHFVHGHFQIAEDTIMLGVHLGTGSVGYWTQPTKSATVDKDDVHGHIYVFVGEPLHRLRIPRRPRYIRLQARTSFLLPAAGGVSSPEQPCGSPRSSSSRSPRGVIGGDA